MTRSVPTAVLQNPGNLVTAALWNSGPKAMGDFYLSPPLFRGRQSAAQTFVSGAWAAVTLDVTDVDTDSGHSNSVNNSRYTAQTTGWYWCLGFMAWTSTNAQADVYCGLASNGSLLLGTAQCLQKPVNNFTSLCSASAVYLNAGDYVEVWGRQDTGANYAAWTNNVDLTPCLNLFWMHS